MSYLVERGGFEPPKAEPADLQSAPFDHSGTSPVPTWSQRRESNPRPTDYKSVALPSELRWLSKNISKSLILKIYHLKIKISTKK
jgi:hypothetical protein